MSTVLLVAAGVVFLVVGLVVGRWLGLSASALAAASDRQALERQLAEAVAALRGKEETLVETKKSLGEQATALQGERDRIIALTGELGTARAEAGQLPDLKAALAEGAKISDAAKAVAGRAAIGEAEAKARLAELQASDGERQAALESAMSDAEVQRKAAEQAGQNLATSKAESEGLRTQLVREVQEVAGLKEATSKFQRELDESRKCAAGLETSLGEARADLGSTQKQFGQANAELVDLKKRADLLQVEVRRLSEERTKLASDLEAAKAAAEERKTEAVRNQEQVQAMVEKLAGRQVEQKGEAILLKSKEGLEAIVKPLAEKLKEFEAKVDKTYDADNRDRASLLKTIEGLQSTQEKLHQDAEALSKALTRDSKQQGDWGELMLEKILETAGLTAGRDFELQVSHTDEEGRQKRPDALIYLPQRRAVVVDAKCSLTAFVESTKATDEAARGQALDAHVTSLRSHVKNLAGKDYTKVLQDRTLDVVLLFVPSEAAFMAALSRSPSLYQDAFRQGVILTCPTTLLATMRVIEHVWRSERQNQGAEEIAVEAGRLLEKLGGFLEAFDEARGRLTKAQEDFDTARKRLASGGGNAMGKARKIFELGARTSKEKVANLLVGTGEANQYEEAASLAEPEALLSSSSGGDEAGRVE